MQCEEAIAKDTFRVAVEREIDTGSMVTRGAGYLHPKCAVENLENTGGSKDDLIEGIKAINYEFFFESISLLHDGGFRIGERAHRVRPNHRGSRRLTVIPHRDVPSVADLEPRAVARQDEHGGARELGGYVGKADGLDGVDLDVAFFHCVAFADGDARGDPETNAAGDSAGADAVAEALGEGHEKAV